MRYEICRLQQVPPGQDSIIEIHEGDPNQRLADLAAAEAGTRNDVTSIALCSQPMRATLVGQPEGSGNKYSPTSSMVAFTATLVD